MSLAAQIVAALQQNAEAAGSGGSPAQRLSDPLAKAPTAAPGSPQATGRRAVGKATGRICKNRVAQSFHWSYYAAVLAALLALPFTLLTGRRLGEYAGDHELTRHARRAAVGGGR